jgi:PAS domain S-box-containing protein
MKNIQQFEALFNHATIGIILCNKQAEIIDFNRQAEEQFGYSKDELIGQKIEVLIPNKFKQKHVGDRNRFYHDPHPRTMGAGRDLHGQKKDGTEFPVEVSLSNYELEGEIYAIAFVIDITIRKNNELTVYQQKAELEHITSQIKHLNAELEQKVENRTKMLRETLAELEKSKEEVSEALEKEKELGDLKTRFVTMASHEFRTPLSTILSSAFLLSKYNGPEDGSKRDKHIERIKGAVSDMKSILEDFLSLGKLEEGSVKSKMEVLPFEDCVAVVENTLRSLEQITRKGQQIKFIYKGDGNAYADPALLRNILTNLISNAIKFSPENASIHVELNKGDSDLILSVVDEGIGISKEDQEHLFERFFRAKNAANIQGTGLGLHIVAKYVELMYGSIDMKSELEKGTSFYIHIPQTINNNEENITD